MDEDGGGGVVRWVMGLDWWVRLRSAMRVLVGRVVREEEGRGLGQREWM